MQKIIQVENLRKRYGEKEVVKGISFFVDKGSLFAFLGPNGAGKSTTISMLSTQITTDGGSAQIDGLQLGKDDGKIRHKLGIVFQENMLDRRLTVFENAASRAGFYGMDAKQRRAAASDAIAAVDAQPIAKQMYGTLSGGQRRKADIARALVHTPTILFLDEPTTGLDPAARQEVWDSIRKLQEERGITIFLTTHYMEEAAKADYVVVIGSGEVIAKGTPAELREAYTHDSVFLASEEPDELRRRLREDGVSFEEAGGQFEVGIPTTLDAVPIIEVYRDLLSSVEVTKGSMDQAFLNLIGKVDADGISRS